MILGRTHVLDYPVNLGLSYVTLIAAEPGARFNYLVSLSQLQGSDSIDIWNLGLELRCELRQGLRTRLVTRFLAVRL